MSPPPLPPLQKPHLPPHRLHKHQDPAPRPPARLRLRLRPAPTPPTTPELGHGFRMARFLAVDLQLYKQVSQPTCDANFRGKGEGSGRERTVESPQSYPSWVRASLPDASSSASDDDENRHVDSVIGTRSQVSGNVGSMPSIVMCCFSG